MSGRFLSFDLINSVAEVRFKVACSGRAASKKTSAFIFAAPEELDDRSCARERLNVPLLVPLVSASSLYGNSRWPLPYHYIANEEGDDSREGGNRCHALQRCEQGVSLKRRPISNCGVRSLGSQKRG